MKRTMKSWPKKSTWPKEKQDKQTLCKQMTPGGERAWDTGLTGSIRYYITLTKNTISL